MGGIGGDASGHAQVDATCGGDSALSTRLYDIGDSGEELLKGLPRSPVIISTRREQREQEQKEKEEKAKEEAAAAEAAAANKAAADGDDALEEAPADAVYGPAPR